MTSKSCFKCGETKPLPEFYKHPMMADGHLNKCKKCTKADVKKHRDENIDRIREYDRRRGSRQTAAHSRAYREKYPRKVRARRMVAYHVRKGNMTRPDHCSECGSPRCIHGHHDDYNKPLDVRWLCAACHCQWHAEHGEGRNP